MPCKHSRSGGRRASGATDAASRGLKRRSFMKSALVIGGASALTTATGLYGVPDIAAGDDSIGLTERNNRQHAWDAFEAEARGTTVPPHYHLVLHADYVDSGTPTGEERHTVERAFDELEAKIEWSSDGLLFTIGYSPSYFDRFDESLPEGLAEGSTRLIDPETTIEETAAPHEDPDEIAADTFDAVLHLASNDPRKLLGAEEALWGNDNDVVSLSHTLEGILSQPTSYPERRTGFAGHEQLEEAYDDAGLEDLADEVPEESGLSMGFNALYSNSVPREELASMIEDQKLFEAAPPGVFAQGSIAHVSKLDVNLADWYDNNDLAERRSQMLSPHHDRDETGVAGENLGDTNDDDEFPTREAGSDDRDLAERTVEDATDEGVTGHVQKLGRTRFDIEARETGDPDEDPDDQVFETPVIRRDFDTTDQDTPGVHFIALMRFNGYMTYMRQAMNGTEFDTADFGLTGDDRIEHESIVEETGDDNGIVPYLDTRRRGNYLLPPIVTRALPTPRGLRPNEDGTGFEVDSEIPTDGDGTVEVTLSPSGDFDPLAVDYETVRFGTPDVVNRGGGPFPSDVEETDDGSVRVTFDAEGTGFTQDSDTARLFGTTGVGDGRLPVFATTTDFELD